MPKTLTMKLGYRIRLWRLNFGRQFLPEWFHRDDFEGSDIGVAHDARPRDLERSGVRDVPRAGSLATRSELRVRDSPGVDERRRRRFRSFAVPPDWADVGGGVTREPPLSAVHV